MDVERLIRWFCLPQFLAGGAACLCVLLAPGSAPAHRGMAALVGIIALGGIRSVRARWK